LTERERPRTSRGRAALARERSVLASLFDAPVAVECEDLEAFADESVELEDALLEGASPARKRELIVGRRCASRALAALDLHPGWVGRGTAGEPLWPAGAVGSISHAGGLCAAAVAPSTEVLALGLDLEPDRAESRAFLERMCSTAERDALSALPDAVERLAVVVFSAKEASCKLQFPLTGDAGCWSRIEVMLGPGEFSVRFRFDTPPLAGKVLRGRWRCAHGFIWTGIALRAP